MRFVCDNCKSKYSIADEKIRGKTMRMACRKCGHVLAIRGEGSEAHLSAPPPTVEEKIAAQIAESIHPGAPKEKPAPMPVVPKAPAAPRIGVATAPRKVPPSAASAPANVPAKPADSSGSNVAPAQAPESGPQSKPKPADVSGANKSAVVKKPAPPPKMPTSATGTRQGGIAAETSLSKSGENASAPISTRAEPPKSPVAEPAPPPPPSPPAPKPVVIPPSMPTDEDDDGEHRSALPPAPRDLPQPTSTSASETRAAAPKPASVRPGSVRPAGALLTMPIPRDSDEPPQRLTLEGLKAASSSSRETAMLFPLGLALGLFVGVIAGVFVMKKQMTPAPAIATSASAAPKVAAPVTFTKDDEIEDLTDDDAGVAPKPKTGMRPTGTPTTSPTTTATIGNAPTASASTSASAEIRITPLSQDRASAYVTNYLARAKRSCVEKHPEALPATIVLTLAINSDGSVASANVNQTEGLHVVGDCLGRGAMHIKFPPSTEGLPNYQTTIHY